MYQRALLRIIYDSLVFPLLHEDLSVRGKHISNLKLFFRHDIMFHIFLMPGFLLVRASEQEMEKAFTGMFSPLGWFPCDSQFTFLLGSKGFLDPHF